MSRSTPRPNYSEHEVRRLVSEYAELKARVERNPGWSGMHNLAQLADLNYALGQLPLKLWEVVLLYGLIGLSQEQTAEALHITQQAVSKRYRQGIDDVLYWINGAIDEWEAPTE